MRTSASMIWNNGVLDFHAFGWGPVVVKRYLEGEQLVWEYADGSTTHMDRTLHPARGAQSAEPRGKRMALFSSEGLVKGDRPRLSKRWSCPQVSMLEGHMGIATAITGQTGTEKCRKLPGVA